MTENDVAAARVNANRGQVHVIEDGTTRGRYATVTAANVLKVDPSGSTFAVGGDVAHDGVDSGNPVKLGLKATITWVSPTAVAALDRTIGIQNRHGIPFMMSGASKHYYSQSKLHYCPIGCCYRYCYCWSENLLRD